MEQTGCTDSATILDRIVAAERERAQAEAEVAQLILDYEDTIRGEADNYADPRVSALEASFAADELSLVLLLPTRSVQVRLAQLRRVRATMPRTWWAFAAGDIDGYRVQIIAEAAAKLVHPDSVITFDERVGPYA